MVRAYAIGNKRVGDVKSTRAQEDRTVMQSQEGRAEEMAGIFWNMLLFDSSLLVE